MLMDGVRRACGSEVWRRRGWRDYPLECALDELVERVGQATGRPALRLPVRFGDVPASSGEGVPLVTNSEELRVAAKSERLRSAKRCILLVDGDVDVMLATDCLILATGRVSIQWGTGNVVVAGGTIVDKERGQVRASVLRPSLLISGSTLDLSHCADLIGAAPEGVGGSLVRNAALLNSRRVALSHCDGCSAHTSSRVDFTPPSRPDRRRLGGRPRAPTQRE
jgi:hypothetical protein